MNRQEFYEQIPKIMKRLFTFGLGSACLFVFFWYMGGHNFYGHFLGFVFKLLSPFVDVYYESGTSSGASLFRRFTSDTGRTQEVGYLINQLNSNLIIIVTLLGTWIHKDWKSFLKLSLWCLLFTLCYQVFSLSLQTYHTRIGPDFASRMGAYWEETTWFLMVDKVAAFDKFILRYFASFPVFLASLTAMYFTKRTKRQKAKKK